MLVLVDLGALTRGSHADSESKSTITPRYSARCVTQIALLEENEAMAGSPPRANATSASLADGIGIRMSARRRAPEPSRALRIHP